MEYLEAVLLLESAIPKKNVTDISQRQTTKKTIQESKTFRENTKNKSHALK